LRDGRVLTPPYVHLNNKIDVVVSYYNNNYYYWYYYKMNWTHHKLQGRSTFVVLKETKEGCENVFANRFT